MEKYQKTWEEISPLINKLKEETLEFLRREVTGEIDLEEFNEDGGMSVAITYDGGNHPEYASNAFSTVTMVYLNKENNKVVIVTEDAEIDPEEVDPIELTSVCDVILDYKTDELRKKFSALLADYGESNPLKCHIIIGQSEAMGIIEAQMPLVTGMFQTDKEGIIWFDIKGMEDYMEFDDIPIEDLKHIYEELTI